MLSELETNSTDRPQAVIFSSLRSTPGWNFTGRCSANSQKARWNSGVSRVWFTMISQASSGIAHWCLIHTISFALTNTLTVFYCLPAHKNAHVHGHENPFRHIHTGCDRQFVWNYLANFLPFGFIWIFGAAKYPTAKNIQDYQVCFMKYFLQNLGTSRQVIFF